MQIFIPLEGVNIEENIIQLKPINDLLKESFFVAHYQRGFRWNKQQVNDLLNDIWEFSQKERTKDEFYCLQPIVVKKFNGQWELIDGQQRLTTILIILNFFNKYSFKEPKPVFTINFQTRSDSKTFLKEIDLSKKEENIDYFHICSAFEVIKEWFDTKKQEGQTSIDNEFYPILLKYTKVIWYHVREDSNPIEIFTRINIGKIPLTNAELIKALFLGGKNFGTNEDTIILKQLEIANEWDRIEYSLQNEMFWYFINKSSNTLPTRIEFIFDLIALKKKTDDDFFTFRHFNDKFSSEKIDSVWKEIKRYFMTFEEWYNDRRLYHLVGYLILQGTDIQNIKENSKDRTKKEFKKYLIKEIKKQVKCQVDDLDYDSNRLMIEKVLLLFNIESMIRNNMEKSLFPFDKYKKEKWSLEHIHARNAQGIKNIEIGKNRLREARKYILDKIKIENKDRSKYEIVIQNIDKLLQKADIEVEEFEEIQDKIFIIFGNESNSISNLALLSGRDNSALNNNIFPIKRSRIVARDKMGGFIPICTRNVFLKYYTKDVTSPYYWGEEDRTCYLKAIKETLANYLPVQVNEGVVNGDK